MFYVFTKQFQDIVIIALKIISKSIDLCMNRINYFKLSTYQLNELPYYFRYVILIVLITLYFYSVLASITTKIHRTITRNASIQTKNVCTAINPFQEQKTYPGINNNETNTVPDKRRRSILHCHRKLNGYI